MTQRKPLRLWNQSGEYDPIGRQWLWWFGSHGVRVFLNGFGAWGWVVDFDGATLSGSWFYSRAHDAKTAMVKEVRRLGLRIPKRARRGRRG